MQSTQSAHSVPWLLAESLLPPDLAFPQNCSQRIKYTCFDVSISFLIFGATSGGLYIFNRDPCEFFQLVPNKEGAITRIKISPDEKCIAFSTHKGTVCICDCEAAVGSYMRSSLIQTTKEHHGNEITSMVWSESGSELYIGDDVGTVSVLNISKSITKNVFQTPAFSLIHFDSRITQLDIKENLLLVSTFTKCYICDTIKEHYAQIGEQLRDGDYGACFFYESHNDVYSSMSNVDTNDQKSNRVNKAFSIVSNKEQLNNFGKLDYLKIFCARPGSRLWEAKTNGSVTFTHQFKRLLATPPNNIVTAADFENNNYNSSDNNNKSFNPQTLTFSKLYMIKNKFILTFTKEGIYIFDPKKPAVILWTDKYSDILDCRIIYESIYIWRSNGNLSLLSFYTIEKFLLKCYMNQKYKLCAQICSNHATDLIQSIPISHKLHLMNELGDKLVQNNEHGLYDEIKPFLEEISKIKKINGQKLKSGIVVVENSFSATAESIDDEKISNGIISADVLTNSTSEESDLISQKSPDAIKVIKDLSNTFSDKLSVGTSKLVQKWNDLEDKMKKITSDKMYNEPLNVRTEGCNSEPEIVNILIIKEEDDNIVYTEKKNESVKPKLVRQYEETDCDISVAVKTIYQNIKLSDNNKVDCSDTFYILLTKVACDIDAVYQIIKKVEDYAILMGESSEYSSFHCGKVFLQYISKTPDLNDSIDSVIADEVICTYFLQALININSNSKYMTSCDCGYPLPNSISSQTPQFSEILNIFIEKRWNDSRTDQCYDICKKVPYMWRKILFLRKNEDLLNLLLLILQMLDEELLYSYLPQFTVDTWKIAIKLLATLKKQECLNCGKKFNSMIFHKSLLNWNSIASLMLKTVGCMNSCCLLKTYSKLIQQNELSLKYYHSCLFLKLFEKFDRTLSNKLIDTIYESYNFEDAVLEMSNHLNQCVKGELPHTALPFSVASKSHHWGLNVHHKDDLDASSENLSSYQSNVLQNLISDHFDMSIYNKNNKKFYQIGMSLEQTYEYLDDLCPNKECYHCCVPLSSRVLIADGGLWVFSCGHTYHGVCLYVLKIKLCPVCFKTN